ncbi:MAG: hypothetical protein MMC33_006672 [Icmadophila ericetorum]|nr:hypothetical protein [Icmadophila ericetorum]
MPPPPSPPSLPLLRHLRHLLSRPPYLHQFRPVRRLQSATATTTSTPAHPSPPSSKTHHAHIWISTIGKLIVWIPIVIFIRDHVVQIMNVQGASMYPFFNTDYTEGKGFSRDRVLVDRWKPWQGIERGMVVAFWGPHRPETLVVKRVIALEGDEVRTNPPYPFPREIVPKGHVWVEGDHPEGRMTMDSNTYGPVSISLIVGKVRGVVWPLSKAGWIRWQDYGGSSRVREGTVDFLHLLSPNGS